MPEKHNALVLVQLIPGIKEKYKSDLISFSQDVIVLIFILNTDNVTIWHCEFM